MSQPSTNEPSGTSVSEHFCTRCGQVSGPDGHGPGMKVDGFDRPLLSCEFAHLVEFGTLPAFQVHATGVLTIYTPDGRLLVSIKQDGAIQFGPDYEPDEAARVFWDAMRTPTNGEPIK